MALAYSHAHGSSADIGYLDGFGARASEYFELSSVTRQLNLSYDIESTDAQNVNLALPPAAGGLFKCSICGDLVYESQLEYHASICLEPLPQEPASKEVPPGIRGDPRCEPTSAQLPHQQKPSAGAVPDSARALSEEEQTRPSPVRVKARPKSADSTSRRGLGDLGSILTSARVAAGNTGSRACSDTTSRPAIRRARSAELSARVVTTPRLVGPSGETSEVECNASSPSMSCSGSGSGLSTRHWRGWQDSNIQLSHAQAGERSKLRRELLTEQLSKREVEQCTFAPRLVAKRPRSAGRLGVDGQRVAPRAQLSEAGEDEWLRQQLLAKQSSVDRVERELYADVTHRPKISTFAKVWARNERETLEAAADRDGRPMPTVFDRLYNIAQQERAARERARLDAEAAAVVVAAAATATSRSFSSEDKSSEGRQQRLYDDALLRRERSRLAEEKSSEQEKMGRRLASHVLERSRRYYWQMLERQLKASLDAATGGGDCLAYTAFEDFLKHFGVLREPKTNTPLAKARAAQDSQKLRVALWRHLDPENKGFVDCLTLIVFFHVLMGAVDEEAERLHNLSAQQSDNSTRSSSNMPLGGQCSPAGASGGYEDATTIGVGPPHSALTAIFEEGDSFTSDMRSPRALDFDSLDLNGANGRQSGLCAGSNDPAAAAVAAAAGVDPEGRRICSLLMRFDPKQLRAEFHQLYLHRLHYTPPTIVNTNSELAIRAPELNTQSRSLNDRVVQRQREDAEAHGGNVESHVDLLHWRQTQANAKKNEMRALKYAQEAQKCTFQPAISTSARRASSADRVVGLASTARLYADSTTRQQRLETRVAEGVNRRSEQELADCSFRPDIKRSGKSYGRQRSTGTVPPRGYDECKQRLRKAFAGQYEKRRFLDDRNLAQSFVRSVALSPPSSPRTPQMAGNGIVTRTTSGSATTGATSSPSHQLQFVSLKSSGREASSARASSLDNGVNAAVAPNRFTDLTMAEARAMQVPTASAAIAMQKRAQQVARRTGAPSCIERPPGTEQRTPRSVDTTNRARTTLFTAPTEFSVEKPMETPPGVFVEVNIAPGRPPERLFLTLGQSAAEAAAEFAARHRLSPNLAHKLLALLQQLMATPEWPSSFATPRLGMAANG